MHSLLLQKRRGHGPRRFLWIAEESAAAVIVAAAAVVVAAPADNNDDQNNDPPPAIAKSVDPGRITRHNQTS